MILLFNSSLYVFTLENFCSVKNIYLCFAIFFQRSPFLICKGWKHASNCEYFEIWQIMHGDFWFGSGMEIRPGNKGINFKSELKSLSWVELESDAHYKVNFLMSGSCRGCCLAAKGSRHERKLQFFLTFFKRPLPPPPPFVWTLCGEFFWRNFNKSA